MPNGADIKRPDESAQPSDDLWVPAKGAVAGQNWLQERIPAIRMEIQAAKENGRPAINQALLDALKGLAAEPAAARRLQG